MDTSTIAVIGLSASSCSLVSRFLRTGHDVVVNDPDPSRHREAIALGAHAVRLPADAAESADIAFVTVPASLVEEVLFDCGGVGDALPEGACVVVAAESTADALASVSARLLLLGLRTVEADIGSDGSVAPVLLGGRREDVARVAGLLLSIGCPCAHVGALGAVADLRNPSAHVNRPLIPARAEVPPLPAMPSRHVVQDPGDEDPAGSLTVHGLEQLVCSETDIGGARRRHTPSSGTVRPTLPAAGRYEP
ncbi:hypothetical protein DQ237_12245 [Blastococcus sp. TF02-8]|uniref:NAD(P)-binding domain-containing protein n=1 Tax=Blastococcus sp. TF02-8 TaxID=2250574 RepID=UPI000DE8A748|nr:NAD(P)-binding domain-containing protein [Blastococcus sp. TF02-8]RBY95903.1 hypothetical protein DQ237_12245 [Blastococcus sp. TF02-8]